MFLKFDRHLRSLQVESYGLYELQLFVKTNILLPFDIFLHKQRVDAIRQLHFVQSTSMPRILFKLCSSDTLWKAVSHTSKNRTCFFPTSLVALITDASLSQTDIRLMRITTNSFPWIWCKFNNLHKQYKSMRAIGLLQDYFLLLFGHCMKC